jgi:hypothetical protein
VKAEENAARDAIKTRLLALGLDKFIMKSPHNWGGVLGTAKASVSPPARRTLTAGLRSATSSTRPWTRSGTASPCETYAAAWLPAR